MALVEAHAFRWPFIIFGSVHYTQRPHTMDGLRVAKVERVVLEGTARSPPHNRIWVQGTLHLTPHHLFFAPDAAANEASDVAKPGPKAAESSDEIWIPYPTINVLQRLPQSASGKYPLLIGTKTFDTYTLLFEKWGEGGAEDVWYSVRDCAVTRESWSWAKLIPTRICGAALRLLLHHPKESDGRNVGARALESKHRLLGASVLFHSRLKSTLPALSISRCAHPHRRCCGGQHTR